MPTSDAVLTCEFHNYVSFAEVLPGTVEPFG